MTSANQIVGLRVVYLFDHQQAESIQYNKEMGSTKAGSQKGKCPL